MIDILTQIEDLRQSLNDDKVKLLRDVLVWQIWHESDGEYGWPDQDNKYGSECK